MDGIADGIGIISGVIGVVIGVLSAVLSWRHAEHQKKVNAELRRQNEKFEHMLKHERQVFDWEAIHKACRALAKKLGEFKPDLIVTTPGAPLAVAALAVEALYEWIPVYVVMVDSPEVHNAPAEFEPDQYEVVQSMNVKWYVPTGVLDRTDARIAIVDDITFNSFYYETLLLKLRSKGMRRENLLTAALVVSEPLAKKGIMDWYFYSVTNTVLHLPWGRERSEDRRDGTR